MSRTRLCTLTCLLLVIFSARASYGAEEWVEWQVIEDQFLTNRFTYQALTSLKASMIGEAQLVGVTPTLEATSDFLARLKHQTELTGQAHQAWLRAAREQLRQASPDWASVRDVETYQRQYARVVEFELGVMPDAAMWDGESALLDLARQTDQQIEAAKAAILVGGWPSWELRYGLPWQRYLSAWDGRDWRENSRAGIYSSPSAPMDRAAVMDAAKTWDDANYHHLEIWQHIDYIQEAVAGLNARVRELEAVVAGQRQTRRVVAHTTPALWKSMLRTRLDSVLGATVAARVAESTARGDKGLELDRVWSETIGGMAWRRAQANNLMHGKYCPLLARRAVISAAARAEKATKTFYEWLPKEFETMSIAATVEQERVALRILRDYIESQCDRELDALADLRRNLVSISLKGVLSTACRDKGERIVEGGASADDEQAYVDFTAVCEGI